VESGCKRLPWFLEVNEDYLHRSLGRGSERIKRLAICVNLPERTCCVREPVQVIASAGVPWATTLCDRSGLEALKPHEASRARQDSNLRPAD
jgi:hypothetical protein